jgi:alginate O-acetyltransferase complex protein AlgI
MVFSSITFLFYFLPATLLLYFLTKWKNLALLLASLFFYSWGEIQFVFVILVSCALNYGIGLFVADDDPAVRKSALAFGIVANLSLLAFFKYAAFFVAFLNDVGGLFGAAPLGVRDIHLPLGISFFTFQAMSYLVDVYRDRSRVEKNPLNLALFIALFPQLIAGPIVRYHNIAHQIKERRHTLDAFVDGIKIFVIGLAQKVLIANTVAVTADKIFALPSSELGFLTAWLGAVSYTLQIYFDFGGYSNMAIGLGLMLGFRLPQNFNYPYIANSITEFWRRWHMSLSRWFKDYLYIPLGGNRHGTARTYFNLWVIFFLCGLWHGASWTFVVWGCYHGLFMVIERVALLDVLKKMWSPVQHGYTLLVVIVGWVLFRCDTFAQALYFLQAMSGLGAGTVAPGSVGEFLPNDVLIAIAVGVVASTPVIPTLRGLMAARWARKTDDAVTVPWILGKISVFIAVAGLFAGVAMMLASGAYNPFIYFRF